MPHIRDPVTHRCVVCQLGRHPSPFPIGWRSGGLPHKCRQWERFEKRRRADARDRYKQQVGSTSYRGAVVLEFGTPQIIYPSLEYDENFLLAGQDDRSEGLQQRENSRRRPGGLRQSKPGTASLDQYHFFNDPLISRTRQGNAIMSAPAPAAEDTEYPQYQPVPQSNANDGYRNVTFSEPPVIAVVAAEDNDAAPSDDAIDGRKADASLNAKFQRRQTRGAFSREEFRAAADGRNDGNLTSRKQSLRQQTTAAQVRQLETGTEEASDSSSAACNIL